MKVKITDKNGLTIAGTHYAYGAETTLTGPILIHFRRFNQVAPVDGEDAIPPPGNQARRGQAGVTPAAPVPTAAEIIASLAKNPEALKAIIAELKPQLEEARAGFLEDIKDELAEEIATAKAAQPNAAEIVANLSTQTLHDLVEALKPIYEASLKTWLDDLKEELAKVEKGFLDKLSEATKAAERAETAKSDVEDIARKLEETADDTVPTKATAKTTKK